MFRKIYISLCLFTWSSIVISQRDNNLLQSATNSSSTSLENLLIKTDDDRNVPALNKVSDLDDKTSSSQDEKRNVLGKELTGEWADVLSGEEVPNEASVKIDLVTGKKMAKIAEDSSNQGKKYLVAPKDEPLSFDALKYGLKSLKKSNKKDKKQDEQRKDYRDEKWTLKEMRFEDLKMETVSDSLKNLLIHYTQSNITGKLSLLDEIEFLVHQYEVAQNFVELGGIDILLHDIRYDNENLQALIAMTLGAAMQGNSFVQLAVLKRDAIPVFLELLRSSNPELQLRAMFALSTLVRHNSNGLSLFISNGGLKELAEIFAENKASEKLKMKIMTLIYDLVLEKQMDEENAEFLSSSFKTGELSQRRKHLETVLKSYGFCHHITSLISSDDENVLEILIQTMSRLVYLCEREFFAVRDKLIMLQEKYKIKAYAELKEQQKKGVLSVVPELFINYLYNSLTDVILVINNCCKDEL